MPTFLYQKDFSSFSGFFPSSPARYTSRSSYNEEAVNQLYRNHSEDLLITIMKLVPHYETAEDILHDTFIKIKNYIHLHEESKSLLLTWSKTIARNVALDHLRLKSSRNTKLNQSLEYSQNELGIKHIYSFNTDCIGLKQLMHVLTPQQIVILQLFYYQGHTHEEISEVLNIPLGTIKTRIRKAIFKLRTYFN